MSHIKWLEVILLFLAIEQSRQQQVDLDCTYKDNCATSSASVADITCEHNYGGGTDVDCTCEDVGTGCPDLTGITYTQLIDTKCSEMCTANIGSCAFWKYVREGNKKKCYLMTSEECQSEEPNRECPFTNSHGDPACLSDKEKSGSCADGTDVSSGITCPGPINSIDDQTKYVQKWKCYNPSAQNVQVDMYAESSMPLNGYCKLDVVDQGSCKTMNPEFRFNCEIDPINDKKGKWKKAEGVIDGEIDDGVIKENILQDVTCTALPLAFEDPSLATQPGRDIVCTQEGITEDSGAYSIPAENYCHMLCDDYDVLSFFTDWTSDLKTRGWFYKVSDGNRETLEKADTLDCWGKRY